MRFQIRNERNSMDKFLDTDVSEDDVSEEEEADPYVTNADATEQEAAEEPVVEDAINQNISDDFDSQESQSLLIPEGD